MLQMDLVYLKRWAGGVCYLGLSVKLGHICHADLDLFCKDKKVRLGVFVMAYFTLKIIVTLNPENIIPS